MSNIESASYSVYENTRIAAIGGVDILTNASVYTSTCMEWGITIRRGGDTMTEHIDSFIKVNCL